MGRRLPVTYAQRLEVAKVETQPWWDRLARMERIADDLREQGIPDEEFPPEYAMAMNVADQRIAAIYKAHGI